MNGFKRRKVLGLAAGAVVMGLLSPIARARVGPAPAAPPVASPQTAPCAPAIIPEPLLEPAAAWIDRLRQRGQTHLFYPVSRLQREFQTGYGRTCTLADMLAQRGEWTIAFSADGTRYARIHPKVTG